MHEWIVPLSGVKVDSWLTEYGKRGHCRLTLYQPLFSYRESAGYDASHSISCVMHRAHVAVQRRAILVYRSRRSIAETDYTESRSIAFTRWCLSAFAAILWSKTRTSGPTDSLTCGGVCALRISFVQSEPPFSGPLSWYLRLVWSFQMNMFCGWINVF